MDDVREQKYLRISKSTFYYILETICKCETTSGSQMFGIGEGTVVKFIDRITTAIMGLKDVYIKWPSKKGRNSISKENERNYGFKGAIGIIDGTTFTLNYKPMFDSESYYSRKSSYCISGQLITDSSRVFRYACIGYPGSVHDSRQFQNMQVYTKPKEYFDEGQYIIGDNAYKLTPYMIRPVKAPWNKIKRNTTFNYLLSKFRIIIEHSIGMLKSRFSRLKHGFNCRLQKKKDFERLIQCIMCCIIIHNICIIKKDNFNDYFLHNIFDEPVENYEIDNVDSA